MKTSLKILSILSLWLLLSCSKQEMVKVQYKITGQAEIAYNDVFIPFNNIDTTFIVPVVKGYDNSRRFRIKTKTAKGEYKEVIVSLFVNSEERVKDTIRQRDCYVSNRLFVLSF